MNQLGDLEKILSAAKEIGENLQKEISAAREENETLKIEVDELREENKILREENEKIYIEMNNLRSAKEEVQIANEAFSKNLNQLVTQLEENHSKTMLQINQLLSGGLQNFVEDYLKKFSSLRESLDTETVDDDNLSLETSDEEKISEKFTEIETTAEYLTDEVAVENPQTAVVTQNGSKKNKMQYAEFYAEEAEVEKDAAAESIKIKKIVNPHK